MESGVTRVAYAQLFDQLIAVIAPNNELIFVPDTVQVHTRVISQSTPFVLSLPSLQSPVKSYRINVLTLSAACIGGSVRPNGGGQGPQQTHTNIYTDTIKLIII